MDTGRNTGAVSWPGTLEPIEPHLRDALDHPIRRDILRALAVAPGPRDLVAISRPVLSGSCTFPVLGYHAQVLKRAALIESVHRPVSGATEFALSEGAMQSEVRRTLQATAAEDRIAGFRARAGGYLSASSGIARPKAARVPSVEQRRGSEGS